VLDDAVWQRATPVSGFRRSSPGDGAPASERSEVRVAYTDDALYVGARLYSRNPEDVSRLRGRRDSFGQQNDQFLVQIDSYHDHRTAFVFAVTPAGGRNDLLAPNDALRGMDPGWDPVWEGAAHMDGEGWSAEWKIPFSQLRFESSGDAEWGIQITRNIARKQESAWFAFTPLAESAGLSRAGAARFLEDLEANGKVVEVDGRYGFIEK